MGRIDDGVYIIHATANFIAVISVHFGLPPCLSLRSTHALRGEWAIVGLIKSLAVELGPLGIRANAILPGVVLGERMNRVIADRAAAMGVGFDAMRDDYLRKIFLRRCL
jgi:hypothetical protein